MIHYWKNKFNSQLGFSLLEILIATSILATSLVALLSAQGGSFLSSERADRLTVATMLARQKMAEVQIELAIDLEKNKFPDSEIEKKGEYEKPYEEFTWVYSVKKVEIPMVEGSGGEESNNALVGSYMKNVTDQISKSVREVKLTVYWGDESLPDKDRPNMSVTTHIVKL